MQFLPALTVPIRKRVHYPVVAQRRCTIRRKVILVGIACVLSAHSLAAQHKSEYPVNVEVSPLFGYRTNMSFVTEPDVEGVSTRVGLEPSPAPALAVGVRYNDADVVEFRWIRQSSRLRVSSPAIVPSIENVTLDQFHLDCSHEYVIEEWPAWARPYILGSVGATRLSTTNGFGGFTRFSLGLGTGIKIFPFRKLGFKAQAQWLALWVNPESQTFCNGGCVIHFSGKLVSQGEVTIGPVFRF
jgi:hypothetical protein